MSYSCYGHRFLSFLPSSLRFLLTFKLPSLYVCPFFSMFISLSVCPPVVLLATVFLSLCVSLCIYLFSFSVPLSLFFLALFVALPLSPFHFIITRIPKYYYRGLFLLLALPSSSPILPSILFLSFSA